MKKVLIFLLLFASSCMHNRPYTCSKGVSNEAVAVCCKVYCKDKNMVYKNFEVEPGITYAPCTCSQPFDIDENSTRFRTGPLL